MIDYNVDFSRWFYSMLPQSLRKPLVIALIESMLAPLVSDYKQWLKYRTRQIERVTITGQVCILRGALERYYPSALGLHYNVETAPRGTRMLYAGKESNDSLVLAQESNTPLAIDEMFEFAGHNMMHIGIPQDVYNNNLTDVMAIVEHYKLPTKSAQYYPIN